MQLVVELTPCRSERSRPISAVLNISGAIVQCLVLKQKGLMQLGIDK